MAKELQQNMQMKLCQASDETLRAIAEEFKLEIFEQRRSTVVCVIFQYIDKELMAKTDEERKSFLQGLRSRHFETPEVTETSVLVNDTNVTGEKSKSPLPQKLENPTIKNMLESTSVFRRQFKIVGQIGHPDEKDKLSFTSLTRQVDSGLKQGYSEQEIVDGVILVQLVQEWFFEVMPKLLRTYLLNDYGKFSETIMVLRIQLNCIKPCINMSRPKRVVTRIPYACPRFTAENPVFRHFKIKVRTLWFMKLTTFKSFFYVRLKLDCKMKT